MLEKSEFLLLYSDNDIQKQLSVVVELKPSGKILGGEIKRVSIYDAYAYINGERTNDYDSDLLGCVNTEYAAELIGIDIKGKIRKNCEKFRTIKQTITQI